MIAADPRKEELLEILRLLKIRREELVEEIRKTDEAAEEIRRLCGG